MYGYKKEVSLEYEEAIEKTKEELLKEGFGVLTEIDVKATLKNKLNVEFDKYIILGACSPSSAYKALQTEPDIGLMLPCNVIVHEHDGKVFVTSILPTITMQMIENDELLKIAKEIETKLKKAIDNVAA